MSRPRREENPKIDWGRDVNGGQGGKCVVSAVSASANWREMVGSGGREEEKEEKDWKGEGESARGAQLWFRKQASCRIAECRMLNVECRIMQYEWKLLCRAFSSRPIPCPQAIQNSQAHSDLTLRSVCSKAKNIDLTGGRKCPETRN